MSRFRFKRAIPWAAFLLLPGMGFCSEVVPAAPVLLSPLNGTGAQSIGAGLSWNTVSLATSYEVQLSTASGFGTTLFDQSGGTAASVSPGDLSTATTYYWHVQASDAGGAGSWSATWSFTTVHYVFDNRTGSSMTINLPVAINPTFNGAPLGDYDEVGAFSKAGLCVGSAVWDSVHNQAIDVVGQDVYSSTADGLNGGDTVYFRVWHFASQREGLAQAVPLQTYSNGGIAVLTGFTATAGAVADPALSFPANGATGLPITLTLSWGSVAGATSYGVQVSAGATFGTTVASQTLLTGQSASIGGLAYNTTYYWRANASTSGSTSIWTGIWSFTTLGPPNAPVLSSPINSATGTGLSLSLNWQAVATAISYGVQVSTVSSFASTVLNQSGLNAVSAPLTGLAHYTTYYWEANAVNATGTSSWSSIWSFTTAESFSIPLSDGWFMYSLNLQPADSSTRGVFGKLKGFILAMDGSSNLYWPSASLDEIGTVHTGSGYWILDTLKTDTLNLTGSAVHISSSPIPLSSGSWNLVAYLPQVNMPIATALNSISSQLVLAMDGSGNFYWPAASLNEITTMTVGYGYYVLTNAAASLAYPAAGSSPAKLSAASANRCSEPPALKHFAKHTNTGNFAVFLAGRVESGGKTVSDNAEIGAFDAAGNLVGAGTVTGGHTAFAVWGSDPITGKKNGCGPGDPITFMLWDGNKEYPIDYLPGNGVLPEYATRTVYYGSLSVPAELPITRFDLAGAYPNPFRSSVRIAFDVPALGGMNAQKIELNVYDMKGGLVHRITSGARMPGHYSVAWNPAEGSLGPGIFIVRMRAKNFDKRMRVIKVE